MAGSFTDKNGIIQAKNINKMLENKISQYNNIQKQYNHLIESSLEVKYNTFDYSFDMNMENAISYLKTKTGWTDLENINEMHGLVDVVEESNDDWKYLGKVDTLQECQANAMADRKNIYTRIVYTSDEIGNDWGKTCYGGVKDGEVNSRYQENITSSLPPDGITRVGGDDALYLFGLFDKLQKEIDSLLNQQFMNYENVEKLDEKYKVLIKKNKDILTTAISTLEKERIELHKMLNDNNLEAPKRDAYRQYERNYYEYIAWFVFSIVLIATSYGLLVMPTAHMYTAAYILFTIFLLIMHKYVKMIYNYVKSHISLPDLTVKPFPYNISTNI
jgi:hypothetical protein|tara:strand:+ start:2490 stop:3482 length:993 start_codon:yes stop_codon:yes gene_type:complete